MSFNFTKTFLGILVSFTMDDKLIILAGLFWKKKWLKTLKSHFDLRFNTIPIFLIRNDTLACCALWASLMPPSQGRVSHLYRWYSKKESMETLDWRGRPPKKCPGSIMVIAFCQYQRNGVQVKPLNLKMPFLKLLNYFLFFLFWK